MEFHCTSAGGHLGECWLSYHGPCHHVQTRKETLPTSKSKVKFTYNLMLLNLMLYILQILVSVCHILGNDHGTDMDYWILSV